MNIFFHEFWFFVSYLSVQSVYKELKLSNMLEYV